jgi:phosphoglycolate phosphatase
MTVSAVVFDLDGTLVDSRADLASSANYALVRHGFAPHSEEAICTFVGDGAKTLIARAADLDESNPQLDALLETFSEHYVRHCAEQTKLMPGALNALARLRERGLPLAVLTNKPRSSTITLLTALKTLEQFSVVVAGGDLPYLKPDPRPLRFVAERLEIPVARLVLVGDGPQDVECGRACGATTIGVKGGLATLERLIAAKPNRLIASLDELPDTVAELNAMT